MNVALWIAQVFVAAVVTLTGGLKLFVPKAELEKKMHWAREWPAARVKLLGAAELLGAVGIVAPTATGIAPGLTPLAALCLAVLMGGAVHTHRRLGEGFVPAVIVLLVCLAIAAGRLVLV